MRDCGGEGSLVAENLGLAMARRAAEILERHRRLTGRAATDAGAGGAAGPALDPAQFAADEAVFSSVLDAVNECMGRFDARPASDRWCDALLQLLRLAELGTNSDA